MLAFLILKNFRSPRCFTVAIIVLSCWFSIFADDSRELLNNLYNDILHSATGTQKKENDTNTSRLTHTALDSGSSKFVSVQSVITSDVDAHLQTEIDKMLKDAQQRHDATIQFMQESK